jgi:hypothetical protein
LFFAHAVRWPESGLLGSGRVRLIVLLDLAHFDLWLGWVRGSSDRFFTVTRLLYGRTANWTAVICCGGRSNSARQVTR